MGFENTPFLPINEPKSKSEVVEDELPKKTVLEKIRKKTSSITKGLILIGGLSVSSCKMDKYSPGAEPSHQPTELALHFNEEKLSAEEYLQLCDSSPEKAFVTASLYDGEDWLGQSLMQAAKKNPFKALEYASRYNDIPEYDEIIALAIDSVESQCKRSLDNFDEYAVSAKYILIQNIDAWINTSSAHEILKTNNEDYNFFASNFKKLSQSQEGYTIGKKVIESAVKIDPVTILENIDQFLSEPWSEEVIKKVAIEYPDIFFNIVFSEDKADIRNNKIIKKLLVEVAHYRPDKAVFAGAFNEDFVVNPSDCKETENGKKFLKMLENSDYKDLKALPEIREKLFNGEIGYLDAEKVCLMIDQISSGQIKIAEALKVVKDSKKYSEILIDIVKDSKRPTHAVAEKYLSKERLMNVQEINSLHERPDQERFASLSGAKAELLYFTISYAEEEMFTSSFNGIFNRLLVCLKNEHLSGSQLLKNENFSNFRTFIRTCTEFGRFDDFLNTMNPAEQKIITQQFVSNIDKSQEPVREAVAIAEVIQATTDQSILVSFEKEVQQQIAVMKATNKPEIEILYKLIASTFSEKGMKGDWLKEIEKTFKLPSLSQIKSSELFNGNNNNIQEYFFYNDEDGKTSFTNFLAQYKNNREWSIVDKGSYVTISSHKEGRSLEIYANKPEAENNGPEEIAAELEKQNIKTLVVVHRGHSYHVQKTIERIPSIAKIVSLGSCGGYRNLSSVLEKAPNAHIISTKGIGTKYVNDPLFKMLNEEILSGHDIVWSDFWGKVKEKVGDERFNSYVAPNKNFGAIFIKAYNQALQEQAKN